MCLLKCNFKPLALQLSFSTFFYCVHPLLYISEAGFPRTPLYLSKFRHYLFLIVVYAINTL